MIVPEEGNKPDVTIHASLHRNNAKTFASLYDVVKDSKAKETKIIFKADRNVLQRNRLCMQVVLLTCQLS